MAGLSGAAIPSRLAARNEQLRSTHAGQETRDGYSLWFRDWLVTPEATDAHGFGAHK